MALINTGSIPIIPFHTFTTVLIEYFFTHADTLTIEGKEYLTSLFINEKKAFGKIKRRLKQNSVNLYVIVWGNFSSALQSEAIDDIKYKNMAETYKVVWIINKLKLLCEVVESHINKFNSAFHTLKAFYIIRQHSGETAKKYFDRF